MSIQHNAEPLGRPRPSRRRTGTALCVVALVALAFLLTWYRTGRPHKSDIEVLTEEIQGKNPREVRDLITRRLGPPDRDIGSGFQIEQWDVDGGVLTFHPFAGPTFTREGQVTRLMRTTNPIESCLFGRYEMTTAPDPNNHGTRYWLGNLTLSAKGRYHYEDSGQNLSQRAGQKDNFFLRHSKGSAQIEYAAGLTPRKLLEDVPDGSRVATVTFLAEDGRKSAVFGIITRRGPMDLEFEGPGPLPFRMHTGWKNYWR
jgi:hypothetical protein